MTTAAVVTDVTEKHNSQILNDGQPIFGIRKTSASLRFRPLISVSLVRSLPYVLLALATCLLWRTFTPGQRLRGSSSWIILFCVILIAGLVIAVRWGPRTDAYLRWRSINSII
jgi:hypothetical protein